MAQPCWWWPLSPWISPGAAWFIFLNAVVAAVAVMSSSCAQHQQQQDGDVPSSRRRLCRSASSVVLDQLRSFSLFSVHPTDAGGVAVPPLDDNMHGGVSELDYHHCSHHEPEVVSATKGSKVAAGESVALAATAQPASAPESKHKDVDAEEDQADSDSISFDEAYAMVQQSRRLPRQSPPSAPPASVATTTDASWPQQQEMRGTAAKGPKRRRRREAEEALPEGKAELNSRADQFIRQFREELRLQRLDSLLRHAHAFGPSDGALLAAVR